ncbi:uncharacterized protein LOC116678450 [Etheostoma spectabile]|uniref:uncharacterized protein LOC116678450 n=1 Tax=Etheostoma spectabile TaxID=54343 RepID=UPI0013AF61C5|nr:uncharacterized protein LOC116678450 [Etheostoma spectabile]
MATADGASAAADAELERREAFLEETESFRTNAFLIINEMVLMSTHPTTILVDEVLHSIFFLGKIHTPPFSPEKILSDDEVLSALESQYSRPFALYSSEVPRRSPFSCLLDMVVHQAGRDNEREIREELRGFVGGLRGGGNKKPLVSKTLCVSQSRSPGSVRSYGVSMSTDGAVAKKILIGASCLSMWHEYVAGAVMTFYPEPNTRRFVRKPYFDGTIRVPDQVRCETFDLYDGGFKPPCKSCGELFGLTTTETGVFPHGNCSEAESLSRLFGGDGSVRAQIPPPPGGDRARAETSVRDALRRLVRAFDGFTRWTDQFYIPQ